MAAQTETGGLLADAILSGDILKNGRSYDGLDITKGGQFGWSPALGDIKNMGNWMSNAAYVKQNGICILLDYPRAFDLVDKSGKLAGFLSALLSVRSKNFSGVNMNMNVNVASHQFGGGGQEQKEVTNVTRTAVNAQHVYQEVAYRPITTFHEFWVELTEGNENTKIPLMAQYLKPGDLSLPHLKTATALYMEPDHLHKNIINAAIVTNMFPEGDIGEREIKSDKTADKPLTELTYTYGGIGMTNANVLEFAQKYLESLSPILHADPQRIAMYPAGAAANVKDSENGYGSINVTK